MVKRTGGLNVFRIVLALVFVAFGLVALGNNLGWWDIDELFLKWWPVILILLGLITVFAPGGSWGGGVFLIFLGIIFLLHSQGIYDISELIWPAMLMMFGVMIWPRNKRPIFSECKEGDSGDKEPGHYHDTGIDHVFTINTLLNSKQSAIRDEQLAGGHGTAVFGNLDIDLREVLPREGAYLEFTAVFGNIRIMVPRDWKIVKHGGPVFGKIDDRRAYVAEVNFSRSVAIEMNAVFGKVELLN